MGRIKLAGVSEPANPGPEQGCLEPHSEVLRGAPDRTGAGRVPHCQGLSDTRHLAEKLFKETDLRDQVGEGRRKGGEVWRVPCSRCKCKHQRCSGDRGGTGARDVPWPQSLPSPLLGRLLAPR